MFVVNQRLPDKKTPDCGSFSPQPLANPKYGLLRLYRLGNSNESAGQRLTKCLLYGIAPDFQSQIKGLRASDSSPSRTRILPSTADLSRQRVNPGALRIVVDNRSAIRF